MARKTDDIRIPRTHEHLVRPRINELLSQAIKNPLTIVCGGMGCGKTRAVYDFTQECEFPVAWLHFPDSRHPLDHFWDTFVRAIAQTNARYAKELKRLGPPDTGDKLHMYLELRKHLQSDTRRLFVVDDFQFIQNTAVLHFFEQAVLTTRKDLSLTSIIILSRTFPPFNLSSLVVRNLLSLITEEELNFTESELHQFLLQQGLGSETNSLAKIYKDTKGWAFITNFVAQILKQTPGYAGYARGAIRQDLAQLIEAEAWNPLSERLKHFFLRLSLTPHRSLDLVHTLAGGDYSLIAELDQQNAFVHYDRHTDSYRIHQLFLDYLYTKQDALSEDERRNTYTTIAEWCIKNDFTVDALYSYEQIGDYQSIVSLLFASNVEFVENAAAHVMPIFDRAPEEVFDRVEFSAAMHIHAVMCDGDMRKTLALIRRYEAKYLLLPEDNAFRNRMLGCIYYYWGLWRMLMCTVDDRYDFDLYFAQQYACLKNHPVNPKCWYQHSPNLWTTFVSSSRAGAPQEYNSALTRSMHYIKQCVNDLGRGLDDLCHGELFFYQGNFHEAKLYTVRAMERAREYRQHEIVSRALFLIMRMAVSQGDYVALGLALKDAERQLAYNDYSVRFLTYDIIIGWYYYILDHPEKMPDWLKKDFTDRLYKKALESLGNYIKVRYFYLKNKYTDLMIYFDKRKQVKTILYERVELLAMEACVHAKMRNHDQALAVLHEAYETAQPNNLVIPFFELGKDMRALAALAEKCPDCALPQPWLHSIRQGASRYARNQALILSGYNRIHGARNDRTLSPKEAIILRDLCAGLSRAKIAAKHTLSINTVKLHINSIYSKLGARNRAEMFRIAAENNIL